MSKNDSDDLSSFIEKEKISSSKLNLLKSYKYYCRCLNQGIWDIYNKISNIEGIILKKSLIVGSNMIFYVFWFLLSYTYNIQLTIFLTERAILLFTEYIIMSGNNSHFTIRIQFSISRLRSLVFILNISSAELENNKIITSTFKICEFVQLIFLADILKMHPMLVTPTWFARILFF